MSGNGLVRRRGWDLNPRTAFSRSAGFKTAPFDRSGTPPRIQWSLSRNLKVARAVQRTQCRGRGTATRARSRLGGSRRARAPRRGRDQAACARARGAQRPRFRALGGADRAFTEERLELERKERLVRDAEAGVKAARSRLTGLDVLEDELRARQVEIDERGEWLAAAEVQLAQREVAVAEREQAVERRVPELERREAAVAELAPREAELSRVRARLQAEQARIEELRAEAERRLAEL